MGDGLRGVRGATQAVHRDLRARILSGELQAGSELAQARVAAAYGLSRAPVREAFRLLEREGLLAAQVNHRSRVTPLSLDDVEHVYALRVVNEALAVSVSLPRLSADDVAEMQALLPALADPRSQDFGTWEARHQRFHAVLVHRVPAPLPRLLGQWAEHTARYRRAYLADDAGGWRQGAREHAQLAEYCRTGEAAAAARLIGRHFSRAALALIASMDPGHDPALLRAAVRQVSTMSDAT